MQKGLAILLNAFWNSKGWKNGTVSDDDFQIAKSQGYMFEYPHSFNHIEAMQRVKS